MLKGLAPRLILSVTAIVILVEVVFGIINARIQEDQLLEAKVLATEDNSGIITRAIWEDMLEDRREHAYSMMRTIGEQKGVESVRIFNKQGRIMFSTQGDAGKLVDLTAEACDMCHAAGEPLVRVDVPSRVREYREGGRHLLGMITPIYNEPACSNAACHAHPESRTVLGVLDVTVPLDRVAEEVAGIRTRSLLVGGVSVFLVAVFLMFFTRRVVVRPVRKLIDATRNVAERRLDQPLEIESRDELGELSSSFETMRERLLDAQREIDDFTAHLEDMVEERTEQLEVTQRRLVQSDRLASLGRLAASVAHEINNPIGSVLNFSALMQRLMTAEGVPAERRDDFRRYLAQIVSETSRAGRIVTDLLSFSRRSHAESVPADLNEVVRGTLSLIEHKLTGAGLTVTLDLDPELPVVPCDPQRMRQVVTNLVLNAGDALRGNGSVRVRTKRIPDVEAVTLVVEDDGTGIDPQDLPKIFDPFFTTKEEGKGVGLGLAVVYGIVETHGGTIEVKSEPGEGTTFTVTLSTAPIDAGGDETNE
ncbi:MAG: ATP-binding protein [Planctomycetota bacterium]